MSVGPLLWRAQATDVDGTMAVRLTSETQNRTGLMIEFEENGRLRVVGLSLSREDLQQLRHAVTERLVALAPGVNRT